MHFSVTFRVTGVSPSSRTSHCRAGRSAYRSFILLRKLPLFDKMELACLEDVASRLEAVKAPAGEHIVRAGEQGDCMYFINAGAVQVGGARYRFALASRYAKRGGHSSALLDCRVSPACWRVLAAC